MTLKYKFQKRALPAFAIAVSLFFSGTAIAAFGVDNVIRVSNPPSEFIIGNPDEPDTTLKFTVIVTGPAAATINLELIDFVYDAEGEREVVPTSSTPYSLAKVFKQTSFSKEYVPRQSGQEFTFELNPVSKEIKQIYFGGVRVKMEPRGSGTQKGTGSTSTTGSVTSVVNVTPFGFAGGLDGDQLQSARLKSVSFTSVNRTSVIDYLIPDFPGLINSGPIKAEAHYENKGQLPVFAYAKWEFAVGNEVLASKGSGKTILLAGETKSRSVITQSAITGSEEFANVLPDFGLVDIQTTVQSELGGTKFEPVVQKSSVLIVQWKEPFFFICLALLILWYVGRRRPAKPGQKRKEPSLLWLAIKALTKYTKKRFAKTPISTQ